MITEELGAPIAMNYLWTRARSWWEIDGSDIYVKDVIAVGGFGAVFRGTYKGRDVAGCREYCAFLPQCMLFKVMGCICKSICSDLVSCD